MSPDPRTNTFLMAPYMIFYFMRSKIEQSNVQTLQSSFRPQAMDQPSTTKTQQQNQRIEELVANSSEMEPRAFSCKMKQLMYGISGNKTTSNNRVIDRISQICGKKYDEVAKGIFWFLKVWKFQNGCFRERDHVMERDDFDVLAYFVKRQQMYSFQSKQESKVGFRELLLRGQSIIRNGNFQFWEKSVIGVQESKKFVRVLVYNNAVCYFQLGMYGQSLKNLKVLKKVQDESISLQGCVEKLEKCVIMKMGKKQLKAIEKVRNKPNNQELFFDLVQKSKEEFMTYLHNLTLYRSKISQANLFNMSLLCKKHRLFNQGILILEQFLSHFEAPNWDSHFKNRCYVLLSKLYSFIKDYQKAIDSLNKVESSDENHKKQVNMSIWQLKKQIKLKNAISSIMSHNTTRKYNLLEDIQTQLHKLTEKAPSEYSMRTSKRNSFSLKKQNSIIYPTLSGRSTSKKLPSSRKVIKGAASHQVSAVMTPKFQGKQKIQRIPKIQKKSMKQLKKIVRFNFEAGKNPEIDAFQILKDCEEKILGAIFDGEKESIIKQVKNSLLKVEQECQKLPPKTVLHFRLKCTNWYTQSDCPSQAIELLRSLLPKTGQNRELAMTILTKLRQIYENQADNQSIVQINNDLLEIGDDQAYDRLGQYHMTKGNYSDSIRYFQQYNYSKNTLYSQLKLAHAYSKNCTLIKKSITMLNSILFVNKSNSEFKKFNSTQTPQIQNAVLLLVSLYLNTKSIKKAQQICQNYLLQNFAAFSIYYMLGIIHIQYHNFNVAFEYFIDALKLQPHHIPSLIQVVKYVHLGSVNKCQIIHIVRKAFAYHHRDWLLLGLFIEVITGDKGRKYMDYGVSVKALIQCGSAIEKAGGIQEDLIFQAQNVWIWAKEYLQKQKGKPSDSYEKDEMTIMIRLGEINLQKGNYKESQSYFLAMLSKLQQKRSQGIKPKLEAVKLELRIMQKLIFLCLEQEEIEDVFRLLDESQTLAKQYFLIEMACQIQDRRQYIQEMNNFA